MKLSSKCEYACLALIYLAKNFGKGVIKIGDIARSKRIPKKFLEQILIILKQRGYVKSRRGAEGGYQLAKSPEQIMLAEIIRLMDGALAPVDSVSAYFYQPTPTEQEEKLRKIFREIRDYIASKLENTSFADLV
jgi:Rrf2 family cysteine metabolism transcriptional repressor